MSAEILGAIADRWIYEALSTHAPLTALLENATDIFPDSPPDEFSGSRYVVYSILVPPRDIRATGSVRTGARPLYLVRAYSRTRSYYGTLLSVATEIDRALHLRAGSEVDLRPAHDVQGTVDGAWREAEFRQPEKHGEEEWRALGGEYRLVVRPS